AHGEGAVHAAIAPCDAHALEGLHALAGALDDLDVDTERVAGAELGDRLAATAFDDVVPLFLVELRDEIHGSVSFEVEFDVLGPDQVGATQGGDGFRLVLPPIPDPGMVPG